MAKGRVYRQACSFCVRRKIKCNGEYPCENCKKRGRAASCVSNHATNKGSGARHTISPSVRGTQEPQTDHLDSSRLISGPTPPSAHTIATPQSDVRTSHAAAPNSGGPSQFQPSHLGANSMPNFVDSSTDSPSMAFGQAMRPALGLQNASSCYPFLTPGSADDVWRPTLGKPFTRTEVLRYTSVYQAVVVPLLPFTLLEQELDTVILQVLESLEDHEPAVDTASGRTHHIDHTSTSLVCAILACGVQMSDHAPEERVVKSRRFAQSAFHFARLSNFLLRPRLKTIQAMLVLSLFLENDGQADAAWALLGTVSRLAMSIGIHRPSSWDPAQGGSESHEQVWTTINWQDCMLSLRFDRPTLVPPHIEPCGSILTGEDRTKCAIRMRSLIKLVCQCMAEPEAQRTSAAKLRDYLARLGAIDVGDDEIAQVRSVQPRRQTLIELLALKLHCGYVRALLCTPAMKVFRALNMPAEFEEFSSHTSSGTLSTLTSFLDLCKFTFYPHRSWSMIHAGLCSAIMVEFLEVATKSSPLRDAQTAFLGLLSREQKEDLSGPMPDYLPWLSSSHSKYLFALKEVIQQRNSEQGSRGSGTNQGAASDGPAIAATLPGDTRADDRFYTQARNDIANIAGAGDGASMNDLSDFDWSLSFLNDGMLLGDEFNEFPLLM